VSLNHVTLSGNLTRDPELRATPSGTSVLSLRLAVNDRVKDQSTGEWTDRPNYFDVDLFGKRADALAGILTRGMKVAIGGRLRWREWETNEGGKRQAVTIVADTVELMQQRDGGAPAPAPRQSQAPVEDDDDIPFDGVPTGDGRDASNRDPQPAA
jgi:single-strand DNA-binding protein